MNKGEKIVKNTFPWIQADKCVPWTTPVTTQTYPSNNSKITSVEKQNI